MGQVREVLRLRRAARIPDEKPPFRGLVSLRGEIVTVVDLVGLHAMARAPQGPAKQDTTGVTTGSIRPSRMDSVVVLRGGRDPLGIEVDGVEDIREFPPVPAGSAAASPGTAPAPGRLWAGVVSDERGEVGVLDTEGVFGMVAEISERAEEPEAIEVGDRE